MPLTMKVVHKVFLIVYNCTLHVTIYCHYLNDNVNIHRWINSEQKVNKSWMMYMTSVLSHCLIADNLFLTFLSSSKECVNKFVTMATDCKSGTNFNFTRDIVDHVSCPLTKKTGVCFDTNSHRNLKPSEWLVDRITIYYRHLRKPLQQECITAHYLQYDSTLHYVNNRPIHFQGVDRLKYISIVTDCSDLILHFRCFYCRTCALSVTDHLKGILGSASTMRELNMSK